MTGRDRGEIPELGDSWPWLRQQGDDVVRLFSALAVLEEPASSSVIGAVAGLDAETTAELLGDQRFEALMSHDRDAGWSIRPSVSSPRFDERSADRDRAFHRRAVEVFEQRLTAAKSPDPQAARRLPYHVRAVAGEEAFARSAFVCFPHLYALGLLDDALRLLHSVVEVAAEGSDTAAKAYGNLGIVYRLLGDLDQAEQMYRQALEIGLELGHQERIAIQYGNLGVVHEARGDLAQAEDMYARALELYERLRHTGGMANSCGNLAIVSELQGRMESAELMYRRSFELFLQLEDGLDGAVNMLENLADLLDDNGRQEEAEQLRRQAWDLDPDPSD